MVFVYLTSLLLQLLHLEEIRLHLFPGKKKIIILFKLKLFHLSQEDHLTVLHAEISQLKLHLLVPKSR